MATNTLENERLLHALKIAAACIVTIIITILLNITNGFIAVVTTFVLLSFYSEAVLPRAVERFIGPSISFLLALLIISLFYDLHGCYWLLLFLSVTGFMYFSVVKIMPYGSLLGGITLAFVMFTAIRSPTAAVHVGFDWIKGIFIGDLVALFFSHYCMVKKVQVAATITSLANLPAKFSGLFPLQKEALQQALKMALALFLIVWTSVYLTWPGDVQALIACAVIMSQPNLGRAHLRFYLRLLGIVAGGIFSVMGLIILARLPYLLTLVILFLMGLSAASYVALGNTRYAYAGVMAGVILPMTLFVSQGPLGTLAIVMDRFAGVFIGAAMGMCVMYFIWPVLPEQQIRAKLAAILRDCATLYQNILQLDQQALLRVRQTILQQIQEKLELIEDVQYITYRKKLDAAAIAKITHAVAVMIVKLEILLGLVQYCSLVTLEDYLLVIKIFEELLLEIEKINLFFAE